jgi:ubiquinone/menaquinone biosynthesis C-methylase UbiE
MLAAARRRADEEGWENVELIHADAARAKLVAGSLDGAL